MAGHLIEFPHEADGDHPAPLIVEARSREEALRRANRRFFTVGS
jgi:hypothetical protein